MGRRSVRLTVAAIIAALGTALVFFYADSANERALAGQLTVEVVVAAAEIPAAVSGSDAAERGLFDTKTIVAVGAGILGGAIGGLFNDTATTVGASPTPPASSSRPTKRGS